MPPSGFNQNAINGLLIFVQDVYQKTFEKYTPTSLTEPAKLAEARNYIRQQVATSIGRGLGDIVSSQGLEGLATFTTENFSDLVKEIHVGKKEPGYAMRKEIDDIGAYLAKFKLHN